MSGIKIAKFGKVSAPPLSFSRSGIDRSALAGSESFAPPKLAKPLAGTPLNMPAMVRFLCAAFPASTAKQVAHLIGVPASTVDKWLRGETRPSGEAVCALVSVFGPSFLAAICPSCAWAQEVAHERDELQAYRTILRKAWPAQAPLPQSGRSVHA